MDDHVAIITLPSGPEPQPRWKIVCPDGCDCDLGAWVDAEGGWPMFDLHSEIEVYLPAEVWWDDGVHIRPLDGEESDDG